MDEGSLGIHEVELMVESSKSLSNGSSVVQHANRALDFSQVTTWHHRRWLVVDAHLEAGRTPVNKLNSSLGLDGGNGRIDILGDYVTAIEEATCHVFAMTRVAFHHLIGWFEAGVGDIGNGEGFVVSFLRGNDGGISGQRKVNPRIRHQVSLELSKIDIEGAVESQRRRDGRTNLRQKTVQICVCGPLNVQITSAHVIESFIVDEEGNVNMLQSGMSTK